MRCWNRKTKLLRVAWVMQIQSDPSTQSIGVSSSRKDPELPHAESAKLWSHS
jgi:hypothetical protein